MKARPAVFQTAVRVNSRAFHRATPSDAPSSRGCRCSSHLAAIHCSGQAAPLVSIPLLAVVTSLAAAALFSCFAGSCSRRFRRRRPFARLGNPVRFHLGRVIGCPIPAPPSWRVVRPPPAELGAETVLIAPGASRTGGRASPSLRPFALRARPASCSASLPTPVSPFRLAPALEWPSILVRCARGRYARSLSNLRAPNRALKLTQGASAFVLGLLSGAVAASRLGARSPC